MMSFIQVLEILYLINSQRKIKSMKDKYSFGHIRKHALRAIQVSNSRGNNQRIKLRQRHFLSEESFFLLKEKSLRPRIAFNIK